jgi:hypothetical protein
VLVRALPHADYGFTLSSSTLSRGVDRSSHSGAIMPRNILGVIDAISKDETFTPAQNLKQIGRIARGFAPMLTEILEDYIRQNTGGPQYRVERIKAAKQMLGAE